jgi:hypothetical protein
MFGLFKSKTKPPEPAVRRGPKPVPRRTGGYDPNRTNGPETPVMAADRRTKALNHAAWRDPSVQVRRDGELRAALAVLERTAACTDLAIERLDEAASAVEAGRQSASPVMRGLLATRTDELLDSLERITLLAEEGGLNLLDGGLQGLKVKVESGGLNYALAPICLRRDGRGFNIPPCDTAFEDAAEAEAIALAIERARVRLAQFANRLAHDAASLSALIGKPPGPAPEAGQETAPARSAAEADDGVLELDPATAVELDAAPEVEPETELVEPIDPADHEDRSEAFLLQSADRAGA